MVAYDLFITFVESFILASFIMVVSDLIHKVKLLGTLTLLFTIETTFFNSVYVNNFLLLIVETTTALIILYYCFREIHFFHIFIILLGIGLIMLSNVVSLFLFSTFFVFDISNITKDFLLYISVTSFSKIFNFLICLVVIYFFKKNDNYLELKKWWLFLLFISIELIMIIILLESIIFKTIDFYLLFILLILLILLLVLAIVIYIKINNDSKQKVELAKQLIKNKYMNKNYVQMNYLHNSTLKERHRMIYLFMKYKDLAKTGKNDELVECIDIELKKLDKEILIQSTSNPYFDYRLKEFLRNLKIENYKIKTIFQFEKTEILDQEDIVTKVIDYINYLIKYSNEEKYLSLYITQLKEYLLLKIEVSSDIKNGLDNKFIDSRFKSDLKIQNGYIELSLLIRLE